MKDMGYGKRVLVDIYTMGKKRIGVLYDSTAPQAGQIEQIEYIRERNGWQELNFDIPIVVDGERNWRAELIKNEYLIRRDDGKEIEWFCISAPEDDQSGKETKIRVQCPHISVT